MKKYRLAFLFTQPPFGTAAAREGLDALLAASAFCEEDEIAICFLFDGVFNLLSAQKPERLLQKDHIAMFKLIELYDLLPHCFVCKTSAEQRGLSNASWLLPDIKLVEQAEIFSLLSQAEKVITC